MGKCIPEHKLKGLIGKDGCLSDILMFCSVCGVRTVVYQVFKIEWEGNMRGNCIVQRDGYIGDF